MKQTLATLTIHALGLGLLIYTASRTLDFLLLTLPSSQQFTAIVGLAAFDGGLVGWSLFYLAGARGPWQKAIALTMILTSLVGVIAAFVGDTLYHTAAAGITATLSADTITAIVLVMATVIALNIAALIGVHLTADAAQDQPAQRQPDVMRVTTKALSENGREPPSATPIASPNAGRRQKPAAD